MKCPTVDPQGVPNLDNLPDDELEAFMYRHMGGLRSNLLFNQTVTGFQPAMQATYVLSKYAWEILCARRDRVQGEIRRAETAEATAQRLYNELPDWARW